MKKKKKSKKVSFVSGSPSERSRPALNLEHFTTNEHSRCNVFPLYPAPTTTTSHLSITWRKHTQQPQRQFNEDNTSLTEPINREQSESKLNTSGTENTILTRHFRTVRVSTPRTTKGPLELVPAGLHHTIITLTRTRFGFDYQAC